MKGDVERIIRDLKESLLALYDNAYEAGLSDQERDDIVKIDEAYDRGTEEGYNKGKNEARK